MSARSRFACASALVVVGCGADYGGSVELTVDAFVPAGEPVHDTGRAAFDVGGREVALTHVEYGELMDCSSGCFAPHVCAIEDGTNAHLFYAAWNDEAEMPVGVLEECPTLTGSETWPGCEPSGLVHPVTATAEFRELARDQYGSGPFRFCFNRYDGRF